MPKFVDIYRQDEMLGQTWCSSILKKHLRHLASKGQLKIEKGAGQQNADNEIAANMIRQQQHETTSYGINDDSKHPYENDQYWDEDTVTSDGKFRYDTMSEVYGVHGSQTEAHGVYGSPPGREPAGYPGEYRRNSKGKDGKGSKGAKGYKGSKGNKGAKGSKGYSWDYSAGGRGAYPNRNQTPKGGGNWNDRNGAYERGGGGPSHTQERYQQQGHPQESASPYVPKKKMVCKVCEWAGRPWHVVTYQPHQGHMQP